MTTAFNGTYLSVSLRAQRSNPPGRSQLYGDCFVASLIAMEGMYAENAGAFFCRNDGSIRFK